MSERNLEFFCFPVSLIVHRIGCEWKVRIADLLGSRMLTEVLLPYLLVVPHTRYMNIHLHTHPQTQNCFNVLNLFACVEKASAWNIKPLKWKTAFKLYTRFQTIVMERGRLHRISSENKTTIANRDNARAYRAVSSPTLYIYGTMGECTLCFEYILLLLLLCLHTDWE